jgi:glycogen synthase
MSESEHEANTESVSFTIRVPKHKDDTLEAIRYLLNTSSKQKLIMRYIDEGMQRDLDPEKTAKLFEERQAELNRLRDAI